jgi:glycosyltransferase involved in cell wall biosynthesis
MAEWHVITSEYPPQIGGVSDYTKLIAAGLAAAGDEVHVWCPSPGDMVPSALERETEDSAGVLVHREWGCFALGDLRRVERRLNHFPAPRRLLVQWVPQGYGYRSINLPFCLWLWKRAKLKHDRIEIMVHEPFLPFGEGSTKQDLAAAVHRLMVVILLNGASRIWVSIPDWETRLRPFVLGGNKSFGWLPVPSNIPVIDDPDGVARVRAQYAFPDSPLVGHFGAYDQYMTELMLELLPSLLNGLNKPSVMLLGKGSLELRARLIELRPDLSQSVRATGVISAADVSRHISACDVMLQPYQDGVSGRRTSVMTALSHGVPVVTTAGKATERCWVESEAVKLTKVGDVSSMLEAVQSLLADEGMRNSMGDLGTRLYRERFDIQQTISALHRSSPDGALKRSECPP